MQSRRTVIGALLIWAGFWIAVFLIPAIYARAQGQEQPIQFGQPVSGQFTASSSTAVYTIEGKVGDKLTIELNANGGNIDPYLRLYNPQGQLIGEDDNGGGKRDARLSGIVLSADGIYRISVEDKNKTDGQYSLMVIRELINGAIYFEGEQDALAYQLSRPWDKTSLTYRLYNAVPGFSYEETEQVVAEAWAAWAAVSPLKFAEVQTDNADIVIEFGQIDGSSNVLGQACPPSSPCAGQVQFDEAENWVLREPRNYDDISLLAVATHEFGHILGLLHSNDANALMYPTYSPYNLKPAEDDIEGVQRMYGSGTGGVSAGSSPARTPPPSSSGQDTVESTIDDSTYIEFWDFDVQAGETVSIKMNRLSGDLDPFLVVIDANNNILAYDDDSGGDLNAALINLRFPQTGYYTVAATRSQQAQGNSAGNYELSIVYGAVEQPRPTQSSGSVVPTSNVQVSKGSAVDLSRYQPLDSILTSPFNNSLAPNTQRRAGQVSSGDTYVWNLPWCTNDAQLLNDNLKNLEVQFYVNDTQIDRSLVTQTQPKGEGNGLVCVNNFVLLSNWQPGTVKLTATMVLRQDLYDGIDIYSAGNYVYEYDVQVQ
ncbi:MAG: matrixin family metalloprotease [Anaerolineae bacterium]|nr:matrixin family metalloprotease [Anaerolineae bacterium]